MNTQCDVLRFIQTDICKSSENKSFCDELQNIITKVKCPDCTTNKGTGKFPQPGCGVIVFTSKD